MNNYRKGDKLLIEVEVAQDNINSCYPTNITIPATIYSNAIHPYITNSCIKQHIPTPRPIKVGCAVQNKSMPSLRAIVISIYNDHMWLEFSDKSTNIALLCDWAPIN